MKRGEREEGGEPRLASRHLPADRAAIRGLPFHHVGSERANERPAVINGIGRTEGREAAAGRGLKECLYGGRRGTDWRPDSLRKKEHELGKRERGEERNKNANKNDVNIIQCRSPRRQKRRKASRDGWVEGRSVGRSDGWMDGWMDGWISTRDKEATLLDMSSWLLNDSQLVSHELGGEGGEERTAT